METLINENYWVRADITVTISSCSWSFLFKIWPGRGYGAGSWIGPLSLLPGKYVYTKKKKKKNL